MKKLYLLLSVFGLMNFSYAQKTTGVVTLGSTGMTAKLDLDNATSKVTLTLTGPSDRWFAMGFNATQMLDLPDVVCMHSNTSFSDDYLTGRTSPTIDPTQNWTVTSNTVSGTIRTIVANRALNTGDAKDYAFNYSSITSLNVIFAHCPTASYSFTGGHNTSASTRGTATMNFTTLGAQEFTLSNGLTVYPNPSNGMVSILKDNSLSITKIRVFDTSAKLLKEIDGTTLDQNNALNLSSLAKGIYFLEFTNDDDKTVKKIQIN